MAAVLEYATPDDLSTWIDDAAPDNARAMLREASILVDDACKADLYDTLPNGAPRDDDYSEAMRDAACSQAESWILAGDDPRKGAGGQEKRLTTSALDGASYSFDTYLTAPDRGKALTFLSASAYRILRTAGLASSLVISR